MQHTDHMIASFTMPQPVCAAIHLRQILGKISFPVPFILYEHTSSRCSHDCANGHTAIVQILIDRGAYISAKDKDEETPARMAIRQLFKY